MAAKAGGGRQTGQRAIVDAARDAFAERGYHGASIRDIAKRAGLSLSVLYYYYAGKQELLYALLDDGLANYFAGCERELAAAGAEPAARLGALVRATVEYRVRRQVQSNLTLREMRNLEPEYLRRFVQRRDAASRLFQEVIRDGVAAGAFRTPHPEEARRAILAMCNAVAQWYDPAGELSPAQIVDRHVHLAYALVEH